MSALKMSLIMDDFKPSVNTLEEVKKLQDLVRKLEIQNLHLRNKQNAARKRSVSPVKDVKSKISVHAIKKNINENTNVDNGTFENISSSSRDEFFDNLEIIGVSDIELSDDESWLYTSPKSRKQNAKNESPYKWLRKDVDDPENKQLQLAKKALLTKLNELEILSTTPVKASPHHVENPAVSNLRRLQVLHKTPLSVQNHDASNIDTRTFTRSKKKQAIDFLEKLDQLNSDTNVDKVYPLDLHRRGSDLSSDSSCHILEDANDVQEVARMQEESLRMSSPLGTPKRGPSANSSGRKISTSRGSVSDQDLSENSVFSTQSADDSGCDHIENNSYQMDSLQHSDQSSPSESPYGSNASLHNAGKGVAKLSGYRRSLPNLNRDPVILRQSRPKVAREDKVHIKGQTVGRKSDTSLQAVPKNKRGVKSPSRLKHSSNQMSQCSQPNFESPPNSEPVTIVPKSADAAESRLRARSGLPRPARASSASRSAARSGIPMPSMLSKKRAEDSWSEGCF